MGSIILFKKYFLTFRSFIFLLNFSMTHANLNKIYNQGLISPWDYKCPQNILELLKPGDLIEFDRKSYRHWSLYEGNGYVIQYNGEGLHKVHLAKIVRVKLNEVVNGSRCRINNGFDLEKSPLIAKETLKRAENRLGEQKYHVLNNNCEHFVKWCRNDHHHSAQAKIVDFFEDYTFVDLSYFPALKNWGIDKQISWADAIRAGYEVMHHINSRENDEL